MRRLVVNTILRRRSRSSYSSSSLAFNMEKDGKVFGFRNEIMNPEMIRLSHFSNVSKTTVTTSTATAAAATSRCFSSSRSSEDECSSKGKRRSPYAILKLKTSATKEDIKSSFRKLAKQYHPDLNPQLSPDISQGKMSEIIQAYDQLMDDDGGFSSRVGDARVALACEMFTLEELRIDRLHDLYTFRIIYDTHCRTDTNNDNDNSETLSVYDRTAEGSSVEINPFPIMELDAHPDDSISDLKRQIQSSFMEEWGLSGRRLDRDRIATGWELIKVVQLAHEKEGTAADRITNANADGSEDSLAVMSYHLFLHSYDIQHGDLIHAVVRKYQEGDKDN